MALKKKAVMFCHNKNYAWQRRSIVLAFLFCVVGIFYYSWLQDAHLKEETYLPLWLRNWSNTYFNLRTAIPFIFLGFLLEAWHSLTNKAIIKKSAFPFWIINTFIATVVVCLAEVGQFFILARHPDLRDVAFGILGNLLGCFFYYFIKIFNKLFFIKHA